MSRRARILLVDDDQSNLTAISAILNREAYETVGVESAKKALVEFNRNDFDLIITDMRMPEMSGLDLLKAVRAIAPDQPMVLLTAYGTVDNAVEAMKLGAIDFLSKPVKRKDLLRVVDVALARKTTRRDSAKRYHAGSDAFLGESAVAVGVRKTIKLVAGSAASVLILGESGTGKEVVANAIHEESGLHGEMVSINCGAIPAELLESELFGYVKGAFTGATTDKKGLFELADRGTLFLDEIGEMPSELQVKLLRVLEHGQFFPLGATTKKRVSFRVVAATNANLEEKIAAGEFREDLYYRLNVVQMELAPLHVRENDACLLANHFLQQARRTYNRPQLEFTPSALKLIGQYNWPGNIRELRNKVERAVVMATGNVIEARDIDVRVPAMNQDETDENMPVDLQDAESLRVKMGTPLKDVESQVIQKTLNMLNGDKKLTAKVLGIHERTIYRKISEGSVTSD